MIINRGIRNLLRAPLALTLIVPIIVAAGCGGSSTNATGHAGMGGSKAGTTGTAGTGEAGTGMPDGGMAGTTGMAGQGGGAGTMVTPTIMSIAVTPATPSIAVGAMQQFK